jgi:hypothetical protein
MLERKIKHEIRIAVGCLPGVIVWNNPVGFDDERKIHYGLAKGASDLILIVDGRFTVFEVKQIGAYPTKEQRQWMEQIRKVGGFASVVRSGAEAVEAVGRARNRSLDT